MDAVLGESAFSVTDDKVSITEMRVHAVSGLTLSLQPSPGNSHTMVAKATGVQTLTAPKQVRCHSHTSLCEDPLKPAQLEIFKHLYLRLCLRSPYNSNTKHKKCDAALLRLDRRQKYPQLPFQNGATLTKTVSKWKK